MSSDWAKTVWAACALERWVVGAPNHFVHGSTWDGMPGGDGDESLASSYKSAVSTHSNDHDKTLHASSSATLTAVVVESDDDSDGEVRERIALKMMAFLVDALPKPNSEQQYTCRHGCLGDFSSRSIVVNGVVISRYLHHLVTRHNEYGPYTEEILAKHLMV